MLRADGGQPRRAGLFAHLEDNLDVEAKDAAARFQNLRERSDVDGVLALVVGGTPAIPAVAFDHDLPRLAAGAPLFGVPQHDIAVTIAHPRRPPRIFAPPPHPARTFAPSR